MQSLTDDHIAKIKSVLLDTIDPYLIIIFGSAAQNRLRDDSDIDVAYLTDTEIDSHQRLLLAERIADSLKRDVHLLDLAKVSTVMQAQIVGKGKIIMDREPLRRQEYFILVLKKYARLNEEREPVLARIRERGRVYGE